MFQLLQITVKLVIAKKLQITDILTLELDNAFSYFLFSP